MIRTINIILSLALVLQTIGCTSQRYLQPVTVPKNALQRLDKRLEKGMLAKITLRKEADVPFKERTFECIIEWVGSETLTIIKRGHYGGQKFTLKNADILIIEYRGVENSISIERTAILIIGVGIAIYLLSVAGLRAGLTDGP